MIYQKVSHIQISPMLQYMLYSVIVAIIDTSIVWILYRALSVDLVASNSVGVVSGFIIHYMLSSKTVFQTEFGVSGFTVYLGTFLMGLAFADWLIYAGKNYLFFMFTEEVSFLFSKGISVLIPFFFIYFLRKILFDKLKKRITQG